MCGVHHSAGNVARAGGPGETNSGDELKISLDVFENYLRITSYFLSRIRHSPSHTHAVELSICSVVQFPFSERKGMRTDA
jgi:hypothetical protein